MFYFVLQWQSICSYLVFIFSCLTLWITASTDTKLIIPAGVCLSSSPPESWFLYLWRDSSKGCYINHNSIVKQSFVHTLNRPYYDETNFSWLQAFFFRCLECIFISVLFHCFSNLSSCWKMTSKCPARGDITPHSTSLQIQSWDSTYQYVVWCERRYAANHAAYKCVGEDH